MICMKTNSYHVNVLGINRIIFNRQVLKQAVIRNMDIFPEHIMFELTEDEFSYLEL